MGFTGAKRRQFLVPPSEPWSCRNYAARPTNTLTSLVPAALTAKEDTGETTEEKGSSTRLWNRSEGYSAACRAERIVR